MSFQPRRIEEVAKDLGLGPDDYDTYGKGKAKLSLSLLERKATGKGRLIMVTAINPTPAGEGKTTTSISLAMGMRRLGKNAVLALREPSLGPVFGVKGGGTGGGKASLTPADDINLHFTGDIHAITTAHNLLSALVDNSLYFREEIPGKGQLDARQVTWGRALDMNDRFLRKTMVGLGGKAHGVPREERFHITAASEIMAVMALASGYADLEERLSRIVVGNTFDGKITARVQVAKELVLRGSASTGFRAPSLAQSFFSSTATNFINVPGQGLVPFEALTLPVASAPARALGAQDLKPEDSKHLSAGVVISPIEKLDFTVDYYNVKIDDRIVLSGNFTQPQVAALLAPFGANSARFFTNAIDTKTTGVDVVAHYKTEAMGGTLGFDAAYNWSKTEITEVLPTPPQLSGLSAVLFDTVERRRIECGQPRDNVRLGADWRGGSWSFGARTARYGEFCSFTANEADHQTYGAKWLTDLEVGYRMDAWSIGVGAQNVFNVFPDRNLVQNSFNGIQTFPSQAPSGMNGRFVYAKLGYRF